MYRGCWKLSLNMPVTTRIRTPGDGRWSGPRPKIRKFLSWLKLDMGFIRRFSVGSLMFFRFTAVLFALMVASSHLLPARAWAWELADLRCEYLQSPLGIDAAKPRLSWKMRSDGRNERQLAYHILVASSLDLLSKDQGDLWDSGKVESDRSVHVEYAGVPLISRQSCFWKVRVWKQDDQLSDWSDVASWSMGLLSNDDWSGAWIGVDWMENNGGPLPWLRKSFTLEAAPDRAVAYVCTLGYYELYVNGKRVDDYVLMPAVSDVAKRGLYLTHDISGYLQEGDNSIALWLGLGWSRPMLERVSKNGPLVRAQFEIGEPTATPLVLSTDASWKTHASPITPLGALQSHHYGGERYDSRLEHSDWANARLDEQAWGNAVIYEPPTPLITAQVSEPNRILGDIPAKSVQRQADGTWLVDMGKNFTGWLECRFPDGGLEGAEVRLEYGDKILSNGELQTNNQYDEYVFNGPTAQAFQSRFNYHAFRWVHIKGLEYAPRPEDITGHWISTDYAPASEFTSSDELLNQIYNTANWTYRCLTLGSYVVDCPNRERLGYGGDSGTSMEMGMTNFQTAPLYSKWLYDWRDSQVADGDLPYTAPSPQMAGGGPAWSGICVTMPWQVYLQYGDQRILEQSYPTMQRWLAFLETKQKDGILAPYLGVGYVDMEWSFLGDWVAPNRGQGAGTRVDDNSTLFFNNCFYVHSLQIAAQTARVLGKTEQAASYAAQADALAKRVHERFLNPDVVTYVNGEQPYLAMPLLFGVTPEGKRGAVMDALRDAILVKQQGHLNTGMHGTYFMLRYLTDQDHNDLVYSIVSKRTYPSWGFMLENGATTIWEEWNGDNAQIHDTLISVGMWFVQGLAGILPDPAAPGFKHVYIRPALVGDLTHVSGARETLYGRIESAWRREDDRASYQVSVPANTTATIMIPGKDSADVVLEGKPLAGNPLARAVHQVGGRVAFTVGSGSYHFTAPAPPISQF